MFQLMYLDTQLLDHIDQQHADYDESVRLKKEEKKQQKEAETREEMHFGSKRKVCAPCLIFMKDRVRLRVRVRDFSLQQ